MLLVDGSAEPGEQERVGSLLNRQVVRAERGLEERGFGIDQLGEVIEFLGVKPFRGTSMVSRSVRGVISTERMLL